MKKTFIKKVEELNNTITELKIESRRRIYGLEEELKQMIYVKDIFLRQITDLKKYKN